MNKLSIEMMTVETRVTISLNVPARQALTYAYDRAVSVLKFHAGELSFDIYEQAPPRKWERVQKAVARIELIRGMHRDLLLNHPYDKDDEFGVRWMQLRKIDPEFERKTEPWPGQEEENPFAELEF